MVAEPFLFLLCGSVFCYTKSDVKFNKLNHPIFLRREPPLLVAFCRAIIKITLALRG